MLKALPVRFLASPEPGGWRRRPRRRSPQPVSAALMTNSAYFEVGRSLGGYGFMNITRLYEGRVVQGPLTGTQAVFKNLVTHNHSKGQSCEMVAPLIQQCLEKVYPGALAGASEADLMAVNELRTHAFLQSDASDICENIQFLLGAFETATGEQWLAFRDDGRYSAGFYAKITSERLLKEQSRDLPFCNPFNRAYKLELRRYFVLKLLNGAMSDFVHMHDHDRLHQSLGPSSVVLKYSSVGTGALSDGLWRRASAAEASIHLERRAFGIADDIYATGLLLAYMALIPFCEAGIMDGISLQRLLENTFRLDIYATRECELLEQNRVSVA